MTWMLVVLSLFSQQGSARPPGIDWATLAVEREAFLEGQPGQYATVGKFDGIGMIYFSVGKKAIEFKGLRRISLPYIGQQADDVYEFHHESFTIRSTTRVSDGEYAFEAVNDGPFGRTVTGRLRYSVAKSSLIGLIEEFQLDEHGEMIKGVMNRYSMAKSEQASAMLKKYDDIFLGGNVATLDVGR